MALEICQAHGRFTGFINTSECAASTPAPFPPAVTSATREMPVHKRVPFPFLRLPKELRFMVYEQLPETRSIKPIPSVEGESEYTAVIYEVSLPVGILATCRQIHDEAKPFLRKKMLAIASLKPTFDAQWDCTEFSYFMTKLYPMHGPILPADHIKQRVLKFFPALDSSSQKAIIKFILRMNRFIDQQKVLKSYYSFRIVQIMSVGGLVSSLRVSDSMIDAMWQLYHNRGWNEEREFKLSMGEKDIGEAVYFSMDSELIIKRGGAMSAFGISESEGDMWPVPEGWEHAPGVMRPGTELVVYNRPL